MTLEEKLEQAEAAYHDLMMGKGVVEVRDSNGEMVRYNAANRSQLAGYINELKRQMGQTCAGPARVWM